MKVCDFNTGALLLTLPVDDPQDVSVAFSPDGTRLVSVTFEGAATVWDAASGKKVLVLEGLRGLDNTPHVVFSPDGRTIAVAISGGGDGHTKVWDAFTGHELLNLPGWRVAFGPNDKYVATADGRTLRLFALDVGDLLALARKRVTRPLDSEECKRYFPGEDCPTMP